MVPISLDTFAEVSHMVTRTLAETDNAVAALATILSFVGRRLGFDAAAMWRVDYNAVAIRCVYFWAAEESNFPNFAALTRARTFTIGQGLPGRVWASRKPDMITELERDNNFPRLSIALDEGLHGAVGAPIYFARQVLGMFEFFSRAPVQADPRMLDLLMSVGAQVGLFLDRVRAEEKLTGAEEQFRLLAETSLDGIVTIDEFSTILYVNSAVERIFGYAREEMRGQRLTMLMPEYLRHVHNAGMKRYQETGQKHLDWDGIELPGLHKNGKEIPLEIAFGEFISAGRRIFSGYVREKQRKGQVKGAAGGKKA
jgi:PAS domain S-box-containing protein